MALGGKMNDGAGLMLAQQRAHQLRVADIAAHQQVARVPFERGQIGGIARIGQQVEIHHRRTGGLNPTQNEIRADEPRPARD